MNKQFCYMVLGMLSLITHGWSAPPETPKVSDFKNIIQKTPFGPLKKKQLVSKLDNSKKRREVNHFVLQSAAKMETGWYVTIQDKRKPKELIFLHKNQAKGGLTLLDVNMPKASLPDTKATIMVEGKKLEIAFNWKISSSKEATTATTLKKKVTPSQSSPPKVKKIRRMQIPK